MPIDEAELGVAVRDGRPDEHRLPLPGGALRLDGAKLGSELGVEMTTGNRRMLEEYAGWWELLDPKPDLRRYERENTALAALGLPQV